MGTVVRVVPASPFDPLKLHPKARILRHLSVEFDRRDGVDARLQPLGGDGSAEARLDGITLSARGVGRYFRLLIWPPNLTPTASELFAACTLRSREGAAPAEIGLASRSPERGWNWLDAPQSVPLSSEWTDLRAAFALPPEKPELLAILLHFRGDVALDVAGLVVTSGSPPEAATRISVSPRPDFDQPPRFLAEVTSETARQVGILVRDLRPDEPVRNRRPAIAKQDPARFIDDAAINVVDDIYALVTVPRKAAGKDLVFLPDRDDPAEQVALPAIAGPTELAGQASYSDGTLVVRVGAEGPAGCDLSGSAVVLAANGLILERGELAGCGAGKYHVVMAVPCSARTAAMPLSIWVPALEKGLAISVGPTDRAGTLPHADMVEGAFEGLRVNPRGVRVARGWARDPKAPGSAVVVDLFADGTWLSTAISSGLRLDVEQERGGSPICGFSIELPANFGCGATVALRVSARARRSEISESARRAQIPPVGEQAEHRPTELPVPYVSPAAGPNGFTYAGVILTQDGADMLKALLESICTHERSTFSTLVIVDHGSTDATAEILASYSKTLPLRPIRRDRHGSFSAGNNVGAAACEADVLVFINNDIIFTEPVVRRMGDYIGDDTGLVGLRLLDPPDPRAINRQPALQHSGIHFTAHAGPRAAPFESRILTDLPLAHEAAIAVPAVTAALMAVPRRLFLEVGGFDEAYFYGWEDIDLAARLLARGKRNISVNAVSAIHARGQSRRAMSEDVRARTARNRTLFLEKWEGAFRRALYRDRLRANTFWTGRALHVGFVVSAVGEAAAAEDYLIACDLGRALVAEWPCKVFFYPAGRDVDASEIDILVVMADEFDLRRVRNLGANAETIAWPRNSMHRWAARAWRERFDQWLAVSDKATEYLEAELGRKVGLFRIGTDADRFATAGRFDPLLHADVVLLGDMSDSAGTAAELLDPSRFTFKVFGQGWGSHPKMSSFWCGEIPRKRMADLYRSAAVIIDDADPVSTSWGALSSRVLDAIACGTLVVTSNKLASDEVFGGELPYFSDGESLNSTIAHYLQDPQLRHDKMDALRAHVAAKHTYRHRARAFGKYLRERAAGGLRVAIRIPTTADAAGDSADWGFALPLRRALEGLGHTVRIESPDDCQGTPARGVDANIWLAGAQPMRLDPVNMNILWIVSHPTEVRLADVAKADRVYVAAELFAEHLRRTSGKDVLFLPTCSDFTHFFPPDEAPRRSGAVFVGNAAGVVPPILEAAIDAGVALSVYGTGWSGLIPSGMLRGGALSEEQAGAIYRRAGMVLINHSDDMRRWGFVSRQVFDAAACGAVAVSDDVPGLLNLFGKTVLTATTPGDFSSTFDAMETNRSELHLQAEAAAHRIREQHSVACRAKVLDQALREIGAERDRLHAPADRMVSSL